MVVLLRPEIMNEFFPVVFFLLHFLNPLSLSHRNGGLPKAKDGSTINFWRFLTEISEYEYVSVKKNKNLEVNSLDKIWIS